MEQDMKELVMQDFHKMVDFLYQAALNWTNNLQLEAAETEEEMESAVEDLLYSSKYELGKISSQTFLRSKEEVFYLNKFRELVDLIILPNEFKGKRSLKSPSDVLEEKGGGVGFLNPIRMGPKWVLRSIIGAKRGTAELCFGKFYPLFVPEFHDGNIRWHRIETLLSYKKAILLAAVMHLMEMDHEAYGVDYTDFLLHRRMGEQLEDMRPQLSPPDERDQRMEDSSGPEGAEITDEDEEWEKVRISIMVPSCWKGAMKFGPELCKMGEDGKTIEGTKLIMPNHWVRTPFVEILTENDYKWLLGKGKDNPRLIPNWVWRIPGQEWQFGNIPTRDEWFGTIHVYHLGMFRSRTCVQNNDEIMGSILDATDHTDSVVNTDHTKAMVYVKNFWQFIKPEFWPPAIKQIANTICCEQRKNWENLGHRRYLMRIAVAGSADTIRDISSKKKYSFGSLINKAKEDGKIILHMRRPTKRSSDAYIEQVKYAMRDPRYYVSFDPCLSVGDKAWMVEKE